MLWWIVTGVAAAVFFGAPTWYLFLKNEQVRRLCYTVATFPLLSDKGSLPGFSASHRDQPLESLSTTSVMFHNTGEAAITQDDLEADDPLTVIFPPVAHILQTRVRPVSAGADPATLDRSEASKVKVNLACLERGQGVQVSILHTGSPLGVVGTLRCGALVSRLRADRGNVEARLTVWGAASGIGALIVLGTVMDIWRVPLGPDWIILAAIALIPFIASLVLIILACRKSAGELPKLEATMYENPVGASLYWLGIRPGRRLKRSWRRIWQSVPIVVRPLALIAMAGLVAWAGRICLLRYRAPARAALIKELTEGRAQEPSPAVAPRWLAPIFGDSGFLRRHVIYQLALQEDELLTRVLTHIPYVENVIVAQNAVATDATLQRVARLQGVRRLYLAQTQLTDAGLRHVARLRELRVLDLLRTRVTDAGLEHVAAATELRSLYLGQTQVTDAGLKHLAGLNRLNTLFLTQTQVTDAGLKHLAGLPELDELDLAKTQVTGAGLQHLAGLTELDDLDLAKTLMTDAGLQHLTGLKRLRRIILTRTPVTDAGLKHLAGLENLGSLHLSRTQVTDGGLSHLAGLTNLSRLVLSRTQVTDAGLQHLANLKKLYRLDLSHTQVTDAGMEHLVGLTYLHVLGLSRTSVTDAGLAHLAPLAELERLDLSQTQVTDAGLKHIAGLRRLRELDLSQTQVTDAGLGLLAARERSKQPSVSGQGRVFDGSRTRDDGLSYVAAPTSLRRLRLSQTRVTDVGLQHIAGLEKLKELDLSQTQVTDAGLVYVGGSTGPGWLDHPPFDRADIDGLKWLDELDLSQTQVTDAGLRHLTGLRGLERLNLSQTQVTDAGLEHLPRSSHLHNLDLSETQVTDAGLKHLLRFKYLWTIDLWKTQVTEAGLAACQKDHPWAKVRMSPPEEDEEGD